MTIPKLEPGPSNNYLCEVRETVNLLVDQQEEVSQLNLVCSNDYWMHLSSINLFDGQSVVDDLSNSINHLTAGADLSSTQLNANEGFVSTVNPAGGAEDSVLRGAPLQFDYVGGESLVVMWKGEITPEASNQVFLGDTHSSGVQGVAFRVNTNGTCSFFIGNSAGSSFSGGSVGSPFDGTIHSFGFVLDGKARTYLWYIDGVQQTQERNSFSSGTVRDSKSIATFNLGTGASKAVGGTTGIATKTKNLAVLRTYSTIDYAAITQKMEAFDLDSTNLIQGDL